jgi:hypothetical protein
MLQAQVTADEGDSLMKAYSTQAGIQQAHKAQGSCCQLPRPPVGLVPAPLLGWLLLVVH